MKELRKTLDTGAELNFMDLDWTPNGRLFCQVVTTAPDGSILGNSKVEMSASASRYKVAQELASHNGAQPSIWADALLDAWHWLDQEHRQDREVLDLESLADYAEPEPLEFTWGGLIPSGFISNAYGDGGSSKSVTFLALALHITQGLPFLGLPTRKGPAVYLDYELNRDEQLRRAYRICRGMGLSSIPEDFHYQALTEPVDTHLPDLIDLCARMQPAILTLDSVGAAAQADPNDAEKMIRLMQSLRKLDTTPLCIDHQSKNTGQSYASKRAIGSGYKDFLARGGIQLELASSESGRASIILRHTKHNFTWRRDPLAFHITYGSNSTSFEVADLEDPEFADVETLAVPDRVHRLLNETAIAVGLEEIMAQCNITSKQVALNAIQKLKNKKVNIGTTKGQDNKALYLIR